MPAGINNKKNSQTLDIRAKKNILEARMFFFNVKFFLLNSKLSFNTRH